VPRSRSRSTAHSSRGHLTTSRLHHEDLSKCPTWRDPERRSPGSPRRRTAERRWWPTSFERPEHLSPTWTRVARVKPQSTVYTVGNLDERTDYQFHVCAENVEGAGPPLTLAAAAQSFCVHACSDIFISFRHRTFNESKPVTFTFLMSCRHAYNVKNTFNWTVCQFSWVCLFILLVLTCMCFY